MQHADLEKHILRIDGAKSAREAFDRFVDAMRGFGYDRVLYNFLTDHPSLGLGKKHALIGNYPEDWIAHYKERKLLSLDPVHHQVLSSSKPFYWSSLPKMKELSDSSIAVMNEGREAGLNEGIGVPLHGNWGEIAGVGLAREQSDMQENYLDLAAMTLLATVFHEKYKEFATKIVVPHITDREKEVLLWASEGKTDQEVAMILGISRRTVRKYWCNIFAKLNVYNKTVAVTKSLRYQIIEPVNFRIHGS